MLVLSRRVGEEIVIDEHIFLRVLEINGSVVKLGLSAPPHVRILRREVLDRGASSPFEERELALGGV
jgi:carbon storage regulator